MTDNTPQRLQAFWNERYAGADYAYGTAPNEFLVSCLAKLPPRGRGLPWYNELNPYGPSWRSRACSRATGNRASHNADPSSRSGS